MCFDISITMEIRLPYPSLVVNPIFPVERVWFRGREENKLGPLSEGANYRELLYKFFCRLTSLKPSKAITASAASGSGFACFRPRPGNLGEIASG